MNEPRRDDVDEVLDAWRRERPDLPIGPMAVWSRLHRLALHLDQRRRAAYAAHDLQTWEFDVLAALRRTGDPYQLSPSQLVRDTHVTSGTMTTRVDRLVERGFVERTDHPDDRRGVLVRLLPAGKQAVDSALADLLAAEETLLSGIGEADRRRLADLLRVLLLSAADLEPPTR